MGRTLKLCSRGLGVLALAAALQGCTEDFRQAKVELDTIDDMRRLRCTAPVVPMLTADTQRPATPQQPSAHIVGVLYNCGKTLPEGLIYNVTVQILLTRQPNGLNLANPEPSITLPIYVTVVDQNLKVRSRKIVEESYKLDTSELTQSIKTTVYLPFPNEEELLRKITPTQDSGPLPSNTMVLTSETLRQFVQSPEAFTVYVGFVPTDDDLNINQENFALYETTFSKIWQERNVARILASQPQR